MSEETIHFESMPSPLTNAHLEEPNYTSLYKEMLAKCNPENYMGPIYDENKVHDANLIYATLHKNPQWKNIGDLELPQELVELKEQAANVLNIQFTTGRLFKCLQEKCNPKQFCGENYHPARLEEANKLYAELERKRDSWADLLGMKEKINTFYSPIIEEQKRIVEQQQEKENKRDIILLCILVIPLAIFCIIILLLECFNYFT